MLHAVASSYGTDPASVLEWSAWRLGLAFECLDAAVARADRRMAQLNAQGGWVFPVFVLGGL